MKAGVGYVYSRLPLFLRKRIDPFDVAIDSFVRQSAASVRPGQRILDAGCGESRHADYFGHVHRVAVDSRIGEETWDYSLLDAAADLHQLPFQAGVFDAVLCTVVLEHVADPLAVLREFRRVLKAGARVWLVTPLLWEEHQKPHDYYRFTSDGLRHLLGRAGFEAQSVHPIGGFFWLLGRRSINFLDFFQRGWLWIIFLILVPLFGVFLPLICHLLDFLDKQRRFTLGHTSLAMASPRKSLT